MNIIVEGCDCTGKDTQIKFIETEFERLKKAVHIFHYSNITLDSNKNIENASKIRYREMFNLLNKSDDLNVFIMNRSHLGEAVYSPIYRGYSGDYVFDYEKDFMIKEHQNTKLILLIDDPEKIIERDKARGDNNSFSLDIDKKKTEIVLFERAFDKSFLDKKMIHLNGRTAEDIYENEIKPFIFNKSFLVDNENLEFEFLEDKGNY